jgi:hypothetical protein
MGYIYEAPCSIQDYISFEEYWQNIQVDMRFVNNVMHYYSNVPLDNDVPFIRDILSFQDVLLRDRILHVPVAISRVANDGKLPELHIYPFHPIARVFNSLMNTYCTFYTHRMRNEQLYVVNVLEIMANTAQLNMEYFAFIQIDWMAQDWEHQFRFNCFPCVIRGANIDPNGDDIQIFEKLAMPNIKTCNYLAFHPVCVCREYGGAYAHYTTEQEYEEILREHIIGPRMCVMPLNVDDTMITINTANVDLNELIRDKQLLIWRNAPSDMPFGYATYANSPAISVQSIGYYEFTDEQREIGIVRRNMKLMN